MSPFDFLALKQRLARFGFKNGRPPSSLAPYSHSPLNAEADEIRLLRLKQGSGSERITCELIHALMSESDFKALSYTWGSTKSIYWIQIDDGYLPCTSNLHTALRHLRSASEDLVLWIDAICIDQNNLEEQSQQVQMMRNIYATASIVLVWLGPSNDESTMALNLVTELHMHYNDREWTKNKIEDPESVKQFYALHNLFKRDYWQRVWVVQEVASACSILVHCGLESIKWQRLVMVQEMLTQYHDLGLIQIFSKDPHMRGNIWWDGPEALRPIQGKSNLKNPDLFLLLIKHATKRATDPRDKIYALVGLSNVPDAIPIDYSSSVRQVYTNLVWYFVNTSRSLDIICALKKSNSNEYELPSWVLDWSSRRISVCDFFNEYNSWRYALSAAGQTTADVKLTTDGVISAKGYYIDTIQELGDPSEMKWRDDYELGLEAFHNWWTLWKSLKGVSEMSQATFMRTLLCDRIGPNSLNDKWPRERVLRWTLAAIANLSVKLAPKVALDATLAALTKEEYWRSWDTLEGRRSFVMSWNSSTVNCMLRRRLVVSVQGIPGLAPDRSQQGDKICVLLGCSVPVIMRPVGDHFIFIGAAYIDGYMTGKGLVDREIQEFEIH